MALGETITREISNSHTQSNLFIATGGKDYIVTGMTISNILYPNAFIILRRNNNILFGAEVKQGTPFELSTKIFLNSGDVLNAMLSDSVTKFNWNSSDYSKWNVNQSSTDWNSSGYTGDARLSIIITLSEL